MLRPKPIPARPSLEWLRKTAKDRVAELRAAQPATTLTQAQLEIARELGAEVVRLKATEPVHAILEFARSHSVGHLVIGRSYQAGWRQALGRTLLHRLVSEASGLDVHVVSTEQEAG